MIKVLIVDDMKILRECLKLALESERKFEVVGCAGNGHEAIEFSVTYNPDVILMDLNMPICSGQEAIKAIKAVNKKVKILVLSSDDNGKSMKTAFRNGADGYVLKDIGSDELYQAIISAYNGRKYITLSAFSCGADLEIIGAEGDEIECPDYHIKLTSRERDVLSLIVEGMTNEEIAETLAISAGRARNIVTDLITKYMVNNRTQLAVIAVKNSLSK